jgi:HSP20 family protein
MNKGHARGGGERKWRAQAMEVLGEDFWEDLAGILPQQTPRTDIYRHEDQLIAVMELAGVAEPESLSVSLTDKWLMVSGEIPYDYPVGEEQLVRAERACGRFSRRIALPDAVNPDEVFADYKNGLLVLRMALRPETGMRTVAVRYEPSQEEGGEEAP